MGEKDREGGGREEGRETEIESKRERVGGREVERKRQRETEREGERYVDGTDVRTEGGTEELGIESYKTALFMYIPLYFTVMKYTAHLARAQETPTDDTKGNWRHQQRHFFYIFSDYPISIVRHNSVLRIRRSHHS